MPKERQNGDVAKASSSSKYIIPFLFAVIAVILYYFWAFRYRAVLSYREQLQLFQTTNTYFFDLSVRPGGISTYIGEFLTQFFNNFWIGAAMLSGMMVLFIFLWYKINKRFAPGLPEITDFILSLIPFISLWLFFGNPDVTLNFIVSILLTTIGTYIFLISTKYLNNLANYLLIAICTSFLYWLAGQTTVIFTLLIIAFIIREKKNSVAYKSIFLLISLLSLSAAVCIWSLFLPYPLSYQLIGIGYLMTPDMLVSGQIIVELFCIIIPLIASLTTVIPQKLLIPFLGLIELIAVVILFPKSYDKTTYRLIDYDYMIRTNNWNGILSYSDKNNPDLPLTVSATNLASGMVGQLDSNAFNYFQHGVEGMFPPFVKETLSSWTTGEIFFQLGLINSAQRFYFEGMEAIPNYNKSSRAIKRLAETAIIRGENTLAEKYLHMLENTLFYKKWATRNLEIIKDSLAVERHPLYGQLRRRMINEDYLFSEGELDKTLGQLYLKDTDNYLAKQYLILYPLLQRDLNKFGQYMGVVTETQPNYNPLLAQQAVAFISMKNGQPVPSNIVPPMVEQSLRSFAQAWTSKNPELIAPHRHTLYYYLLSNE